MKSKKKILIIAIICIAVIAIISTKIIKSKHQSTKDNNYINIDLIGTPYEIKPNESYVQLSYNSQKNIYYYGNYENDIIKLEGIIPVDTEIYHNVFINRLDTSEIVLMNTDYESITKSSDYEDIKRLNENLFEVENKDGKKGIINFEGKVILEPKALSIDNITMEDSTIYIAKISDEEYNIYGFTGALLLTSKHEIAYKDIDGYKNIFPQCSEVITINNNLYNLVTGKLIAENYKGHYHSSNIYEDEEHNLFVYDAKGNLLKEYKDASVYGYDEKKEIFSFKSENKNYYIKKDLTIVDETEEKNSKIKEIGFAESDEYEYYMLPNGENYIIHDDHINNQTVIANKDAEKIFTISNENYPQIMVIGNLIEVTKGNTKELLNFKGESIMKGYHSIEDNDNGIVTIYNKDPYSGASDLKTTITNGNFTLEFNANEEISIIANSLISYNKKAKKLEIFDNKGEKIKTFEGVKEYIELVNNSIIIKCEKVYYIYNCSKNKDVIEYKNEDNVNQLFIPVKDYNNNFQIIETPEAFYDIEGNKLLEK